VEVGSTDGALAVGVAVVDDAVAVIGAGVDAGGATGAARWVVGAAIVATAGESGCVTGAEMGAGLGGVIRGTTIAGAVSAGASAVDEGTAAGVVDVVGPGVAAATRLVSVGRFTR
jgi:hypothetical protein